MSKQVLSVEQMQHLQELGLELGRTEFYWARFKNPANSGTWVLYTGTVLGAGKNVETIPAYTLHDILDVLPKFIHNTYDYYLNLAVDSEKLWCASYDNYDIGSTLEYIDDESPIDAAYELLCWAMENGYVEMNKNGINNGED